MDLATKVRADRINIEITGIIKTVADTQAVKDAILGAREQYSDSPINFRLLDTFIITSSLIGFLIKVIQMDHYSLSVSVGSAELYEMLEDMNLIDIMNVIRDNA